MANQDNYGYFGPNYSYADAVPLPGTLGVKQDASISGVINSTAAINTYIDVIAFGGPTFFDQANPQPMGIRYFMNTGTRCSNGATMSQYVDNVTKGDALGASVQTAMASAGLPGLRGLAPGMVENAISALDPRPIMAAVSGTGYPVCQQVMCPVGDIQGRTTNPDDGSPVILGDLNYQNSIPYQTRWVQALDSTGSPINVSQSEFAAQAKCYNADGTYNTTAPPTGCAPAEATPQNGIQGSGPYANCFVTQPATLPPTLAPSTTESFVGSQGAEAVGAAIAVGILGSIVLWSMRR